MSDTNEKVKVSNSEITKQYWKEARWPILVALLYIVSLVIADLWKVKTENETLKNILKYIALFFPAVFFVGSWTGAWVRIKKDLRNKKTGDESLGRLEEVANKLDIQSKALEEKTNHLLGHLTGADSYCFYEVFDCNEKYEFYVEPELRGVYNLKYVRVIFMNFFTKNHTKAIDIPELHSLNSSSYGFRMKVDLEDEGVDRSVIIMFYGSNGYWTQNLTFVREKDNITVHTVVVRREYYHNPEVEEELYRDTYTVGVSSN